MKSLLGVALLASPAFSLRHQGAVTEKTSYSTSFSPSSSSSWNDCQDVQFTLFLDEYPEDIGFRLMCDGQILWNVPVGNLTAPEYELAMVERSASCVLPRSACWLTLYDDYGDGLTRPRDDTGFFALTYGSQTVALYDGTQTTHPYPAEFSMVSFCFGPACPQDSFMDDDDDSLEEAASSVDDDDDDDNLTTIHNDTQLPGMNHTNTTTSMTWTTCQVVQMTLTVDEYPAEVGYNMSCIRPSQTSPVLYWSLTRGSLNQQFATLSNSACVDLVHACCTLTLLDSPTFGDGLTSPMSNRPGQMQLTSGAEWLASYDGSQADADYVNKSFEFGQAC